MKKFLFLLLCLTLCGCSQVKEANPQEPTPTQNDKKVVELIPNDKYEEPLNSYSEMNEAYNALTNAIQAGDAQQEATEVARSFAFDFFTLANKKSSEDVGGLQFIPSVNIRQYQEYAESYYYANYGVIVNEYSKKDLPKVIDVEVIHVEPASYTYHNSLCDGYDVTLKLTYDQTKLDASMLKTSMIVSVINILDYDFSRDYNYQDAATIFEGEMKDCWRVLALE